MGNNAAFTAFEATVVACHNKGVLDKDLLSDLMEPYRDSDIDSGGKLGTLSKDGLEVEEIVLKVFGVKLPAKPKLSKDYKTWTPEQSEAHEDYHDKCYGAFCKITKRFGW